MPAEEVKDAIDPFEKLYEPELDRLEIEEEYPHAEEIHHSTLLQGAYFDDLELDCN